MDRGSIILELSRSLALPRTREDIPIITMEATLTMEEAHITIVSVRSPIPSHIDLAGNTSYHFAASRTVSPQVSSYLFPGTVCAFWLTYMIVSLASI